MKFTPGEIDKVLDSLIERITKNSILKLIIKIGIVCAALNIIYGAGKLAGQFFHSILK